MAITCNDKHPLQYDGTSQYQRFIEALEPGSAKIQEFTLRDWMNFSYHFAEHLQYYNVNDDKNPDGNWQVFMKAEDEIESYLKDAALVADENWISTDEREKILKRETKSNYEPHLALFLCFLKLLKFPQEQINGFTKRHLDFYYTKVLALSKQPAVPDRVYLIIEIAKNATAEILTKDTVLDAGKDLNGKPLRYVTAEEIVVNTAQVALLKSVFHKPGASVLYAEKSNSSDGLGTEFKEENPKWQALGDENWPAANLGFALASSVLLLKEGERTITVTLQLNFSDTSNLPTKAELESQLKPYLTGEKDWMPTPKITVSLVPASTNTSLEFSFTLDSSQKAIVPYNVKLHKERLTTNLPVLRVLINTGDSTGYKVYAALAKATITSATIKVDVAGAKDLAVENDNGKLDPSKPFFPFGPVPKAGSHFFIGSKEIFQKEWTSIKLNVVWKNKPDDLMSYYKAYRTKFTDDGDSNYDLKTTGSLSGNAKVNEATYFKIKSGYIKDNKWFPDQGTATPTDLFADPITVSHDTTDTVTASDTLFYPLLLRKGIDVNKATLQNYLSPQQTNAPVKFISARFESANFNPGFKDINVMADDFNAATKENFLRLTLQQDFLHSAYPRLFALAMATKVKTTDNVLMPNEPYTPTIASITLDYSATVTNTFVFNGNDDKPQVKLDNFTSRNIQLFHEAPFGQSEQHAFLKEQNDFLDPNQKRNIALVSTYSPEGEFYIGLQDAQPSGIVNILFQVAEGSENPQAPTFSDDEKIEWYSLSNNEWKSLNKNFIVGDTTNNLLRSGIIKFTLPADINSSNTILDDGLFWLKCQLPASLLEHTSICKMIGVYSQAVEAVFSDNGNELSHLTSSLQSGTIKKFIDKPALVKGVSQPFASFGGKPQEDERAFYIRVSERLRHKMRAVNIWDYEHLVLQQFPSVYKVKCLNHTSMYAEDGTSDYFELSPGYVTLIVIPDIRNKNSYDPLQPRASQNLLREIEDFLKPLFSLHIKFDADNPDYETIMLDFRVKFYNQYDANTYQKILNDDLIRYLSPWAFGDFADIHFGGTLYKSVIIRFIEERPYVDFISQFKMYQRKGTSDNNVNDINLVQASSARAILVSTQNHTINLIEKDKVCDE